MLYIIIIINNTSAEDDKSGSLSHDKGNVKMHLFVALGLSASFLIIML